MNYFMSLSKKMFLTFSILVILNGCASSTPKIILLQYKAADYTVIPLQEFEEGTMEIRYVENDLIYGQVYDTTKNFIYFNTVDLYCFDLKTKQLEWKNYQKFERIMDYMNVAENMYYYEYFGIQENTLATFYRFIDGKSDEKLYEEFQSDMFNCPQFFRYHSSFVLLSVNENNVITIRVPNESNELEEKYSYDDLSRCIVATAKMDGDYLYFEALNEESKSLYRVNLTNGKRDLVLEHTFDRFTMTSSYIVLHEENKELIFNKSGELLKTYEYDPVFRSARWTSKMKDDGIIVTDFNNNMYYHDLNDEICYQLSTQNDPIIRSIPVRFLTTDDSIIAESDNTLYQIQIHL